MVLWDFIPLKLTFLNMSNYWLVKGNNRFLTLINHSDLVSFPVVCLGHISRLSFAD